MNLQLLQFNNDVVACRHLGAFLLRQFDAVTGISLSGSIEDALAEISRVDRDIRIATNTDRYPLIEWGRLSYPEHFQFRAQTGWFPVEPARVTGVLLPQVRLVLEQARLQGATTIVGRVAV